MAQTEAPAPKPPKVQLTQSLRQQLQSEGLDPDEFALYFATWKALGPAGEYTDYYFGKDAEYATPVRAGKRVLRHVHMPPTVDPAEIARWDRSFKRRSRKTSDTSLIYAFDGTRGYLLIEIFREPKGHEMAAMTTPESVKVMNHLADVASAFIFNGVISI